MTLWQKCCGPAAVWGLSLCVLFATTGCRRSETADGTQGKTYVVRGKVVMTDAAKGEIVLDHEAIPGFMMAMTMPYPMKDPSVLSELHPGDLITADVLTHKAAAGGMDMKLDHIVVVGQARPDTRPKVQYHVPAVGDVVPDYPLLNQSGRKIRVSDFRGRVLVLTFVYTRCQMANFCPRMSQNFAEIDKALAGDAVVYAKTHLLSLSFDPEYDTPAVLKSYGGAYTGKYTKETFGHWDFAAPSVADLPKLEQWFDLGVTPGEGTTITHSLATVVVGKDGKVAAYYPTNDWKVEDVLKVVKQQAAYS